MVCCLTLVAQPSQAQGASPDTLTARAAGVAMYETIKTYVVESVAKLPADQYGFRPAPEVRSFGEVLGHVGNFVYASCGSLKGEPNPNKVNLEKASAEAVAAGVRSAFAYCDTVVAAMTEETAFEPVLRGQRHSARIVPLFSMVAHANEHYGNLVTYMRLKGVVPPSTERAQRRSQ
jgi:uncharacterized damage-inducible protein DinB